MKAKVQYGDLEGTVVADISDDTLNYSLQECIVQRFDMYDAERYDCRGCRIYIGERGSVSILFVCYDKEVRQYVGICPKKEFSLKEVFAMFKRLDIVLGDIEEIELGDECIYID